MYFLLSGYPPFYGETDTETAKLVRDLKLSFEDECFEHVSADAKDLMKKLLMAEPRRLSSDEAFHHEWTRHLAPRAPLKKLEETRKNMGRYSSNGRVKKLAMYLMAKRLSAAELDELKREFENIDKNHDGTITFHELKAALDQKRTKESAEEIRKIFEQADVDGNKRIAYTEFLAAASDHRSQREEEAYWAAFNVFDNDGSGMISKKELLDIFKNRDANCVAETLDLGNTTDSIAKFLSECDTDKDGMIDFDEFLAMIRDDHADSPAHKKHSEH
jgi:calcium-dependent protein kinase